MSTFVVRMNHSSDQCPRANSKVRERVQSMGAQIPQIADKAGVKVVVGPLVLASEHESVVVVEADRVEAVDDFVTQAGLTHWNVVRVSLAQPLADAVAGLSSVPPPLY